MIFGWTTVPRLLGAAVRAWYWSFRNWNVFVDDQIYLDRKVECLNCEFYDEKHCQCKICTCFIEAKTMLASEQCPKRKWLRVKQKNVTV
jgi:hypothetical protein